jgi:nitrate reductase NapE component
MEMLVQRFALIAGIIYAAVGVLGFFPALVTPPEAAAPLALEGMYGRLLGLFPINWVHNLVHLALGVWGLAAAKGFSNSVSYSRGLAVIYAILAVMGLFPVLNVTFGLVPLYGHDIWLHALTAGVAAYFGWGAPARARTTVRA